MTPTTTHRYGISIQMANLPPGQIAFETSPPEYGFWANGGIAVYGDPLPPEVIAQYRLSPIIETAAQARTLADTFTASLGSYGPKFGKMIRAADPKALHLVLVAFENWAKKHLGGVPIATIGNATLMHMISCRLAELPVTGEPATTKAA